MKHPPAPRKSAKPARLADTVLSDFAFAGIKSPLTVKAYERDWARFLTWAELPGMDAFLALEKRDAALLVDKHLQWLEDKGLKPATRSRAKQAICSIVHKLYDADIAPWTLSGLKLIRKTDVGQYGDVDGISEDAWLRLLSTVQADGTEQGIQDTAILLLLYDSALRSREVATLRLRDYRADEARVHVWQKTRDRANRVPVPITARTKAAIDAWCELRSSCATLFVPLRESRRPRVNPAFTTHDVAYTMRVWCELAGVWIKDADGNEKLPGPHQLRHARITHLSARGMPLPKLKVFARHRDVNTTMHYIHESEAEIREWMEQG